ncbi:MAG: copper homeostasis protein CutC [Planctomycetia bacterium]
MTQGNISKFVQLELCAGGICDVELGARLKVDRIELNSGMVAGGLTPSQALTIQARSLFKGPIVAMVRPREGGFTYSQSEFLLMLREAELLMEHGVNGIAVGFLKTDRTIDIDRCSQLKKLLPAADLVFHKAFDWTPDLFTSLGQLIDCGFTRILTSGGRKTAADGASVLQQLQQHARSRIEILPGGGIRAANVLSVLDQSGCLQVHSAVREIRDNQHSVNVSALHFGIPGEGPESYGVASEIQLQELIDNLAMWRSPNGRSAAPENGLPLLESSDSTDSMKTLNAADPVKSVSGSPNTEGNGR